MYQTIILNSLKRMTKSYKYVNSAPTEVSLHYTKNSIKKICGLPIGYTLKEILACFFLEFLELNQIQNKLLSFTLYFRYIDGISLINPHKEKNYQA